jgi:hypothetical protein
MTDKVNAQARIDTGEYPELAEVLENHDTNADAVRAGLRELAKKEERNGAGLVRGLTQEQRQAYNWLLDRSEYGEKVLNRPYAETALAEKLGISKQGERFVERPLTHEVLLPLRKAGCIRFETPGTHGDMRVVVAPPEEASDEFVNRGHEIGEDADKRLSAVWRDVEPGDGREHVEFSEDKKGNREAPADD